VIAIQPPFAAQVGEIEPASGSEKPAPDLFRAQNFGEKRFFCASVPKAIMVGPINPNPSTLAMGGASASAISCQKNDLLHQAGAAPA